MSVLKNVKIVNPILIPIKNGASVNGPKLQMFQPIYLACLYGYHEMVEFFLNKGIKVNQTYIGGTTLLYLACRWGYLHIVRLLVKKGASINQAIINGSTPLFTACKHGHFEVVKYLVDMGAEVNSLCIPDEKFRFKELIDKKFNVLKIVAGHISYYSPSLVNTTPLYIACQEGHLRIVKFLLQRKADINLGAKGKTPLIIAIKKGHSEIVNLLRQKTTPNGDNKGRAVQSQNEVNKSREKPTPIEKQAAKDETDPLYAAYKEGNLTKVISRIYTNGGGEINRFFSNGYAPLHVACRYNHLEIVKYLIKMGAKVNMGHKNHGATPLYNASRYGHIRIVKYLIEKDANVNKACIDDGTTPLYASYLCGNLEIANLLRQKGGYLKSSRPREPLFLACQFGDLDKVKSIIQLQKNNVNQTFKNGMIPLYIASRYGHLEIVKFLVYRGAKVNSIVKGKETPLTVACGKGHYQVAIFLIDNKADVNLKNPLSFAREYGQKEIVKLLLSKGARQTF